jgi:hypothetical protein
VRIRTASKATESALVCLLSSWKISPKLTRIDVTPKTSYFSNSSGQATGRPGKKSRVLYRYIPNFLTATWEYQYPPSRAKLEKDQAGAPDQVTAAEPGQEYLGDDQLDLEKQKGRQEAERVQKIDFLHDVPPIPQPPPPFNG